jgi:hypothetical protein
MAPFRRLEMSSRSLKRLCVLAAIFCLSAQGCSQQSNDIAELRTYPLDDMTGILTTDGVSINRGITSDGRGSLQVAADEPVTVRLFETGDIDIENARLLYQARVRTAGIDGEAYLEMWCHFPGRGEYFSRSLHSPLSGTNDWTTQETPFFLKSGENPDNVKLNLVIAGSGIAWIDDVKLIRGPLQ